MNKYKLVKFNVKDKKNSTPYTITKITPKSNKKVNFIKTVDEILDNLVIPDNKEIRICVLTSTGWRGTNGYFYTDVEQLKKHLYDPRIYAPEGYEKEFLKDYKISKLKVISKERRITW